MKFLYFYRVPVPDPRADAIQIVNTCAGIMRAGGDVTLHVETLGSPTTAECLGYYGIDVGTPPEGRMDIVAIGRHWSWPFFGVRAARSIRGSAGARACLFVREVRPYVPGLVARARAAGLKVIFEAHNVSASLVREKESKAAGGPRSFSMVGPEGRTALKLIGEADPAVAGPGQAEADPAPSPPAEPDPAAVRGLRRKAERRAALEAAIVGSADGLICTQRATMEALRPLMKAGAPAAVLGNGTQIPAARDGVEKDIDVLYCGSLKQWKGVDTLVAAMQTLLPWKLTIVGPATREDVARVQQAALAVGAVGRVRILPPVPPTQVWDLYARAKVGVIPLPGEAFIEARDFTSPLKLFEMMAAGLPIIASRLKSISEYVTDGREAVLVTADDPRPLAEALRRVLTDEDLRSGLAAAARARAAEFTWEARGRKILAFAGELFG